MLNKTNIKTGYKQELMDKKETGYDWAARSLFSGGVGRAVVPAP